MELSELNIFTDWLRKTAPNSFEFFKDLKKRLSAEKSPKKSIVYYTGNSAEEWVPSSLERGIAGSQTAIIYLCQEWVKLGYKVTVYSRCGSREGIYDGVEYRHYSRFNQYDTFDILIIWRDKNFGLLDRPIKAKKIFIDLHDVPYNKEKFTQGRVEKVNKIFVKSQYHRSFIKHINNDKFIVIPNGADGSILQKSTNQKELYKLVYSSNYIRGLELMLTYGWPIIKKEVPEAQLNIYYGWNFFDESYKRNPERQAWKQKMLELIQNLSGVTDYGRIGQDKLVEEKSTSAIHYYACTYQEVDCISVRESAMVGCVPVTTDFAALAEKPYCVKVAGNPQERQTQEAVAHKIVELLKDRIKLEEIRQQSIKLVKNETWSNIAQLWVREFSKE